MKSLKMTSVKLSVVALTALVVSACTTTVKPTYVSPTQYQAMNCLQLTTEFNRIQQYINNGVQPAKRTGVGVGTRCWWWLGQRWLGVGGLVQVFL